VTEGLHGVLDVAAGSCVRDDANVGAAGFCGEFLIGGDVAFGGDGSGQFHRWHFTVEGGVGTSESSTAGNPAFGLAQSAGGPHGLLRVMFGHDISKRFFARGGFAVLGNLPLKVWATGFHGVLDLGTLLPSFPVSDDLEIGIRALFGSDGMVSTGLDVTTQHSSTLAYGTQLFARLIFR
jgi:hypothetical protein